ncbi:MAG: stage IV sporulation protein A [Clostridia bacterium]
MEKYDVYSDIAKRCDGNIYIGVVGPCRTGKSTFITRFIETVVMPNVHNKNARERLKDELPQSANGRTIMTTEPKFIPGEAVKLSIDKKINLNVRLIDCVGYLVDGALGKNEGEVPRMVKTPWSDKEMSFDEASELGTSKVITEHANLGVVVTTDGTITELPRDAYIKAEERVVEELKSLGKPFVVLLNSKTPRSEFATSLAMNLSEKYQVDVMPINISTMTEENVYEIMAEALNEFELKEIEIALPSFMQALPYDNKIIQDVVKAVKAKSAEISKMSDSQNVSKMFEDLSYFEKATAAANMGDGRISIDLKAVDGLFYQVLSEQCGVEISSDFELVSAIKGFVDAKTEYDKIKEALNDVKETGYGVVSPSLAEMTLEEPEVTEKNGQFGVKLKASAPSMHIMRVDVDTEINPVVGTQAQGEEMIKSLLSDFENDPQSLWNTNIFGKSLNLVVKDGLNNKLTAMPNDVKVKMRKTVGRIINEGKGGVICILL